MRVFGFLLGMVLLPVAAWADVSCYFFEYKCTPEFDEVEVRLHESTDRDVCYKAVTDKAFQHTMAERGYYTTEDVTSDDEKSYHTGMALAPFKDQVCHLKAQDVSVNMVVIPQGHYLAGACGEASNLARVNISSDKDIFSGDLGNVCGKNINKDIRSVSYRASKNEYGDLVRKQMTIRGYDGGRPYEETTDLKPKTE